MKIRTFTLVTLALLLAALILIPISPTQADQNASNLSRVAGRFNAALYNWRGLVVAGNSATGSQTVTIGYNTSLVDGRQFLPFGSAGTTLSPVTFDIGANQETITPTAVSNIACPLTGQFGPQISCSAFTGVFANTHGLSTVVTSGSFGLQEAILDASANSGGLVTIDKTWGGAAGAGGITPRTSFSGVSIEDLRSGAPIYYIPSGTTYAQAGNLWATTVLSTGVITPGASGASVGVFTQTFTLTGLASGDNIVAISVPTPTNLCPLVSARATSANTVSLDWAVLTAAACTPAAGAYKFVVVR